MKLYCICGPCGEKITLSNKAVTRQQLAVQVGQAFNITCTHCISTSEGNVKIVYAESSYKYAQGSGVIGGATAGAFFGPIGMIIGGIAGAVGGRRVKNSDKVQVDVFNNS